MKGSSSKESCSWHHRSVTCQLFRFNYSFVWTFYPSCFLQDFGFILSAALAGSTPAPAARNSARFQARPPGDTQLVAFAGTFSSAFGVRAHRSIIPTYRKQTSPENSAIQEQLLLSYSLLIQIRSFDLPCRKTTLLWAAAVSRDDSNIALSSLMV